MCIRDRAAVPARPTGQTTLSVVPDRRKSEIPPAALRMDLRSGGSAIFAYSEPRRGLFGPLGALGPPPFR
eukprot:9648450-Alexandrium_andersonii.AAC.1